VPVQSGAFAYCPVASQYSGVFPSRHRVGTGFGAHTPWQVPFTHAWFTHVTGVLQVPTDVQVSTPSFEHLFCPGAHCPVQVPSRQVWFVHVPSVYLYEHFPPLHVPVDAYLRTVVLLAHVAGGGVVHVTPAQGSGLHCPPEHPKPHFVSV